MIVWLHSSSIIVVSPDCNVCNAALMIQAHLLCLRVAYGGSCSQQLLLTRRCSDTRMQAQNPRICILQLLLHHCSKG